MVVTSMPRVATLRCLTAWPACPKRSRSRSCSSTTDQPTALRTCSRASKATSSPCATRSPPGSDRPATRPSPLRSGALLVIIGHEVVPVDGWLQTLIATVDGDVSIGGARPRAIEAGRPARRGALWPCLAVRRQAYERSGGFAAASRPGVAGKTALVTSLERDGWAVVDSPTRCRGRRLREPR